jgi:hypothetical protein
MTNLARMPDLAHARLISLLREKIALADMAFARSFAIDREEAIRMVTKASKELHALGFESPFTEAPPESGELARLRADIERRKDALDCRLRELTPTHT